MARGYTKEFLVEAYMHKFISCGFVDIDNLVVLEDNANKFYDRVGKDEFRVWASLDAQTIKEYKNAV